MNWNLLHKYLTEECTPGEMQEVEEWLYNDERNIQFMDSLKAIWGVEPEDEIKVNARAAWNSFKKKISEEKNEVKRETSPVFNLNRGPSKSYGTPQKIKRYSRFITISLSAAAVLIFAVLFYQFGPAITTIEEPGEQIPQIRQIVTDRGQRTTLRLFDGTQVQLNAASKIRIPSQFGDSTRLVYLEGEAYFKVAHNPNKPFIVHTGKVYTKVLGTEFGVRAYADEEKVQVVVAEGKVVMGSATRRATQSWKQINENQMGTLSEQGETVISRVENIDHYVGWRKGQLIFNDAPLSQVKPQLERWYDIEITFGDPLLSTRRLEASFNNEPLTEVLNVIALSLDLQYDRDGRSVIFKENK